jgi:UDP-glucose 4-epimerase
MAADRRALVTGGAGFVGAELCTQLVADGWRVDVLDDLSTGTRARLASLPAERCRLVVGDVRDRTVLAPLVDTATTVFHLACLGVRHSLAAPRANADVNADGALALLEAARAARVRRVVHVSSSEVYGSARRVPMDEAHPTEPTTVYGAAKLAGEAYARAFHRSFGVPVVIVRPFNAYGPGAHHEGASGELIPRFLLRALAGRPLPIFGDGTQSRDFTYVADTARGIRLAASADGVVGATLNLGSGDEVSVRAIAALIAELVGASGPVAIAHSEPRPGDVLRLCADAGRARALLGWHPTVGLAEGLARTLRWYRGLAASPADLLAAEVERAWETPGTEAAGG